MFATEGIGELEVIPDNNGKVSVATGDNNDFPVSSRDDKYFAKTMMIFSHDCGIS